MSRRKQSCKVSSKRRKSRRNKTAFLELINWFLGSGELFTKDQFHGNTKWDARQLVVLAVLCSWQEAKFVTDAFDYAFENCEDLGLNQTPKSYTSLMNALERYHDVFYVQLTRRFQELAEEACGRFFETDGFVLIGFDGSRVTAPRTVANEKALCPDNYGKGKRAKYGKKKSKGMRRKRNMENPPYPQAPQAWVTMMWHMEMRLPWTWRLGPSNSSERDHVKEMLRDEGFHKNTLFCGDAGFVGYPLWSQIIENGNDFLVRVGGNVNLLSEHAELERLSNGIVLCWPKDAQGSKKPPLRLRLVKIKIGKTKMWMLTSVLERKKLSTKQIIRYYKQRWGIEVEFRGLKQTLDKHTLRCRNPKRLLVELDWSIRGMAVAELLALHQQIMKTQTEKSDKQQYTPKHRSLANTMRALRKTLRNLTKYSSPENEVIHHLSQALVKLYNNTTDKRARYRPKNPDKKPLGEPNVRKLNDLERKQIKKHRAPTVTQNAS